MTRYISVLLFFAFLAFSSCTDGKHELTADTIIANTIKAYGGEDALRSISSKVTQGTTLIYIYDSLFRSTPYLSYEKSLGKSYYVSPPGGDGYQERLIFASNGKSSWTQNDGALHPYPQPQSEHRNINGEDFPYLFNLEQRGINLQFIETIVEEGLTLHRIDYTKGSYTEEVYFNAETSLIFKTHKFIETSQGRAENTRYFRDYRNVAGAMISFREESFFPPRELDVHLINKLEINTEVDDQIFEFPVAPELSIVELERFMGTYQLSEEESLQIIRKDDTLVVSVNGKPEVPAQVVAPNFIMYRDGLAGGSRMANVFLKTDENNRQYLEHTLRKKTIVAYKD